MGKRRRDPGFSGPASEPDLPGVWPTARMRPGRGAPQVFSRSRVIALTETRDVPTVLVRNGVAPSR